MRVRFLDSIAGENFAYRMGEVVDNIPDDLALQWVKAGYAEPVTDIIESAVIEPAERATFPRPKRRRPKGAPK